MIVVYIFITTTLIGFPSQTIRCLACIIGSLYVCLSKKFRFNFQYTVLQKMKYIKHY